MERAVKGGRHSLQQAWRRIKERITGDKSERFVDLCGGGEPDTEPQRENSPRIGNPTAASVSYVHATSSSSSNYSDALFGIGTRSRRRGYSELETSS